MASALGDCANRLLDTAPLIMRAVRREMRSHRTPDLSVPQFRTLAFIRRNSNASLSDLAQHLDLRLPSAAKFVDGLVGENLITRQESATDRRRVALALTRRGEAIWAAPRAATQAQLLEILRPLAARELKTIHDAMNILHPLFAGDASVKAALEKL